MATFEGLPDGVLLDILSRLPIKQVARVSQLCRRLYAVCKEELQRRSALTVTCKDPGKNFEALNRDCNSPMFGVDSINATFPQSLQLMRTSLSNIRYLRLNYCEGVNDENVYYIGKYLPNLNKLWISDMGLTDEGLSILFTHCDSLETLILGAFQMNGSCFKYLPPLKNFSIEHFEFDSQCFELLSKTLANTLQKFSFYFYYHNNYESFNDWILEKFLNHFPKLKTFKWYCNPALFDYRTINGEIAYPSFYYFLSSIHEIEELALSYCPTLPMQQIRLLPTFDNLKSLCVSFYAETSDDCFAELVAKFPNLNRLHFEAEKIDTFAKSIQAIQSLYSLRELSLNYGGHQRELHSLLQCKSLRRFKLSGFENKEFRELIEYVKEAEAERSDSHLTIDLFTKLEGEFDVLMYTNIELKIHTSDHSTYGNWPWINTSILVD